MTVPDSTGVRLHAISQTESLTKVTKWIAIVWHKTLRWCWSDWRRQKGLANRPPLTWSHISRWMRVLSSRPRSHDPQSSWSLLYYIYHYIIRDMLQNSTSPTKCAGTQNALLLLLYFVLSTVLHTSLASVWTWWLCTLSAQESMVGSLYKRLDASWWSDCSGVLWLPCAICHPKKLKTLLKKMQHKSMQPATCCLFHTVLVNWDDKEKAK